MKHPPRSFYAIIDRVERYCVENDLDTVRKGTRELTITATVEKPSKAHIVWHHLRQLTPFHLVYEATSQAAVPTARLAAVQQQLGQQDPFAPETLSLSSMSRPMYQRTLETSDAEMTLDKIDDLYLGVMIMLDELS